MTTKVCSKRKSPKRDRHNALRVMKRRRMPLHVIPLWADLNSTHQFYINRPEGFEVDHIIPLKSRKVCGLHTLENLQYLTPLENREKHNKFESDWPRFISNIYRNTL